jgi:hypothetical protein
VYEGCLDVRERPSSRAVGASMSEGTEEVTLRPCPLGSCIAARSVNNVVTPHWGLKITARDLTRPASGKCSPANAGVPSMS